MQPNETGGRCIKAISRSPPACHSTAGIERGTTLGNGLEVGLGLVGMSWSTGHGTESATQPGVHLAH